MSLFQVFFEIENFKKNKFKNDIPYHQEKNEIRKIKVSKASKANCDLSIKRFEYKIKKNESNSGDNSIQQIIQRENALREEINIYRNRSDEPAANNGDNNINNQTNKFTLYDRFSNQNENFSPFIPPRLSSLPEEPDLNFLPRHYNSFPDFLIENDLDSEILDFPTIISIQNNHLNEIIIENPTNDGNNIRFFDINSSNRNEFNPQNRNTNNNNPNIMDFHSNFQYDDSDRYLLRLSRINGIAIKNIKKKLTKIKFKKSISSNGNSEKCIICYEDFKNYQNVYSLPCHHLFHVHCLNREIKYRQKCPICRNEL